MKFYKGNVWEAACHVCSVVLKAAAHPSICAMLTLSGGSDGGGGGTCKANYSNSNSCNWVEAFFLNSAI